MSEEGSGQKNPTPQEDLTPPQKAFDELKTLMRQMEHNPYTDSSPRVDRRRKVFWDGDILEINSLQRGTSGYPQIDIVAFRADQERNTALACSFNIIPDGLDFFQLHFKKISFGNRDSQASDVWFASETTRALSSRSWHNVGQSATLATNAEPTTSPYFIYIRNSLIPLEGIVDWVKSNVASPKYVPFPPITLSSS